MNILETKNLTKKYGNITAVDNLNITISQGSVCGILGPNGSGKTTTLASVLGIVLPTSGTFKWFNYSWGKMANKRLGAIIENSNFYPYLTAQKNLEFVAAVKEIKNYQYEIKRVLKIVNLFDRKDSTFSTFSFGMKRRLSLAAALLGNPEILIFDEPTNGLDPQGIAFVRELISDEAKKGKTIILASHILDEVEKVCSDVLILKKGNLIASGKVDDVLKGKEKIFIKSEDNKKLHELLVKNSFIKKIEIKDDFLIVILKDNIEIRKISELALNNKIIITSLELKKKTLEAEFLELVK